METTIKSLAFEITRWTNFFLYRDQVGVRRINLAIDVR